MSEIMYALDFALSKDNCLVCEAYELIQSNLVHKHYTWQEFNGSALPDDTPQPKGSESWPQDALHGKIKDVLGDMKKVVPAARRALRQGIDVADAGPQGREKSDQALSRALRFR